jgi:3-dehydroshikimate dehydratase
VRGYYGAGLAVHDSQDVEIRGFEIRNFCLGVVALRSNNVNIHHMRIVDHHGAAGVIFTGDNGDAGVTDLSFNNRLADSILLDNGDGFEFTRGARDSILEGNYFALTQPLPVNGNAVEFATSGNNNMVIGNVMTAYAITSMTVGSGTGHIIRDNDISFNGGPGASFGGSGHVIQNNNISDNGDTAVSLGGSLQRFEGNRVLRNGGIGISITSNNSQGNTITRNSIADNGGLGIDLAPAGVNANDLAADCADGFPDCDAGPNGRQNFPVLNAAASVWSASGVFLSGSLASRPSQTYTIEFFASRAANPSGHGEGEVYLGSIDVTTDATGNALFTASLPLGNPLGDGTSVGHFTATATDPTGATSEFSQAIQLAR